MGNHCCKAQHGVSDNRGNPSSRRNGSGSTSNFSPTDDYHNGDKTGAEASAKRSREAGLGVPMSGLERVPGPNHAASAGEVNVKIPSAHVDLNTHSANEEDAPARHGTAGDSGGEYGEGGGNDSGCGPRGESARKERRHHDHRSRRERGGTSTSKSSKGGRTGTASSNGSGRREEGGSHLRERDKKARANGDVETDEAREKREKRERRARRKRKETKAAVDMVGGETGVTNGQPSAEQSLVDPTGSAGIQGSSDGRREPKSSRKKGSDGEYGESDGNDSDGGLNGESARKERRHHDQRSRRERGGTSTSKSSKGGRTGTASSNGSGRREEGGSHLRERDKKARANGDVETDEAREKREKRERRARRKRKETKAAVDMVGGETGVTNGQPSAEQSLVDPTGSAGIQGSSDGRREPKSSRKKGSDGEYGESDGNDSDGGLNGESARKERRHHDQRSRRERGGKATSKSSKGGSTGPASSNGSGRRDEGGSHRRESGKKKSRDKKARANGDVETDEAREKREKRERRARRKRKETKAAVDMVGGETGVTNGQPSAEQSLVDPTGSAGIQGSSDGRREPKSSRKKGSDGEYGESDGNDSDGGLNGESARKERRHHDQRSRRERGGKATSKSSKGGSTGPASSNGSGRRDEGGSHRRESGKKKSRDKKARANGDVETDEAREKRKKRERRERRKRKKAKAAAAADMVGGETGVTNGQPSAEQSLADSTRSAGIQGSSDGRREPKSSRKKGSDGTDVRKNSERGSHGASGVMAGSSASGTGGSGAAAAVDERNKKGSSFRKICDSLAGGFSTSAAGEGGGGGGYPAGGGPAGGGGGGGDTTSGKGDKSDRRTTGRNQLVTSVASRDVREKYEIERSQLGFGRYGVVRKCWDKETRESFAIKTIEKAKVGQIESLRGEIEILRCVDHPRIIKLYDVYEDDRFIHLVTELCTGGELFDRIIQKTNSEEGHYSEKDAKMVVLCILDGIEYCHNEHNICHRDLKPDNLLFTRPDCDTDIKIIDFGLSRFEDMQSPMTTLVGTPYYVAPEVLARKYDKTCDLWSIGVITYILLAGYPPFNGESDPEIFASVRHGYFDFPSPGWDSISVEAKDFIRQLLQKDPSARMTATQAIGHRWFDTPRGRRDTGPSEAPSGSAGAVGGS